MLENIMRSIALEIELFKETHKGDAPGKIFVSIPLFFKIQRFHQLQSYVDDGLLRLEFIRLFGIPVQPYPCDEEEYYLAEQKGKFRTFANDYNQLFIKEDIYKKEGAEE